MPLLPLVPNTLCLALTVFRGNESMCRFVCMEDQNSMYRLPVFRGNEVCVGFVCLEGENSMFRFVCMEGE